MVMASAIYWSIKWQDERMKCQILLFATIHYTLLNCICLYGAIFVCICSTVAPHSHFTPLILNPAYQSVYRGCERANEQCECVSTCRGFFFSNIWNMCVPYNDCSRKKKTNEKKHGLEVFLTSRYEKNPP